MGNCETEQNPVDSSWVQILPMPCVSCFQEIALVWPPRTSLNIKEHVQIVASQGRDGMQKQRSSSQETLVQLWGRALNEQTKQNTSEF